MKRHILPILIVICALLLCSCENPYQDPDSGKLDTSALALDALDEAFPDIVENISREQLLELLEDDRCREILTERIVEYMSEQDAAMKEYCTAEDARDLMIYAFGEEGDAWADDLTCIYGSDIIEQCK